MNFLKKKIKTVVGSKRNKDDDDDDFDNYIPEVPPHPSTFNEPNGPLAANFSSNSNFANFGNSSNFNSNFDSSSSFDPSSNFGSSQVPLPLPGDSSAEEPKEKLSLEELKARELEHKKAEKEKLKETEDSKKDNAEWAYFLSLTAKVDAVTSKTQSVLTKLTENSAIEEIRNLEDAYLPGENQKAALNVAVAAAPKPKAAGGWAAFEEESTFNPSDPNWSQQAATEEAPAPIIVDEKIARELIDDFGFTNIAPGLAPALVPLQALSLAESSNEPEVDPFDTSFIDVEALQSGAALPLKPTELIQDLDFTEAEFDPFDTSHITESAIPVFGEKVSKEDKKEEEEEDVK